MKNISRRVFIKGLAVAGVAAAASTVLAGCNTNMIPGVDDDQTDETPESPVSTITFTDPDNSKNTLTIVSKSFAMGEVLLGQEKTATIEFQVDNNLAQTNGVAFIDAATTLSAGVATSVKNGKTKVGTYYVKVSAYADGSDLATVKLATDAEIWAAPDASTGNFKKGAVATKKLTFDVTGIKKSVTVKMAFMEVEKVVVTGGSKYYPVVRQVGDAKEFTYTL